MFFVDFLLVVLVDTLYDNRSCYMKLFDIGCEVRQVIINSEALALSLSGNPFSEILAPARGIHF